MSTRIVLVHYPDGDGEPRLLGLIAETAPPRPCGASPADFVASGIANDDAPYLGPVATDARGLVQWIDVSKLLPASVRDAAVRSSPWRR